MQNSIDISEADLVKAKNNRKHFEKLYLHFIKEMYSFAFYLSGSKEDAEDITSDAFLKAFNNIHKFEGNVSNLRAWIYKILRNTAYEYFRKKKFIKYDSEVIDNAIETNTNDEKILIKQVFEKISEMDEIYREVLILFYKNGFNAQEIADITGKTYENIRQIISRGNKKLKELINFK